MAYTSTRVPLCDGDQVVDHKGNKGYARLCRKDGRQWIGVFIHEGPDLVAGRRWAKIPGDYRPLLDYDGGTVCARCTECDRLFLSRPRVLGDLGGLVIARDVYCRTHRRAETDPEGYVGSEEWKTQHHAAREKDRS